MSMTPEALARMYPSLPTKPTESVAAPVVAPVQPDASAQPAVTQPVVAEPPKTDELSEVEKELAKDQRMYPPEKALEHIQIAWPVEIPPEEQSQLSAAVHTELGRKLMMGPEEAKTVVGIVTSAGEVTAEQQATWKSTSETWLRNESKRTGVSTSQMLANAKAYLARSETATKLFTDRGLLNHPEIVKIAVERGRVARNKGLLK